MLTKSNGIGIGGGGGGGDGIITANSFSLAGFGDVFGAVAGPNGGVGPVTSPSNNNNLDGLLLAGTSSSIREPVITFSPVKDAELRRRARNNAILAKIQELEANACVQAARSDRLRMMREEYEALVRKYAGNGRWTWGQGSSSSNGFPNENSAYRQAALLARYNPQQPFVSAPGPQQLFAPTRGAVNDNGNAYNQSTSYHQAMAAGYMGNAGFTSTIGVNTEITGPVRAADAQENNEFVRSENLEKKRFKLVVDTESQTEVLVEPGAQASALSSWTVMSDGKRANQNQTGGGILMTEKGEGFSAADSEDQAKSGNKNLSMNLEMMMMLEDEDEESLLEAQDRRKFQLDRFHHQQLKQPKGVGAHLVDETQYNISSPSAVSSPIGEAPSSNNTTEEVFKLGRREQLKKKDGIEKSHKKFQRNQEGEQETSADTTTISVAKEKDDRLSKRVVGRNEITDVSLTDDSTSMIQKHNLQRKRLMEELAATVKRADNGNGEEKDSTLNDSTTTTTGEEDDTKGKSVMESELVARESGKKEADNEEEILQQCSSPTTAGATSESLGDSLMDSIQKTPDTLPRDDSELHGIAEANEEEQEGEEIELDDKVSAPGGNNTYADEAHFDDDGKEEDGLVKAASSGTERKQSLHQDQPAVNEGKFPLKTEATREMKELLAHRHHDEEQDEINDAEEIRSNNLSSSKLGVLVEEENNFAHANHPGEEDNGVMNARSSGKVPPPVAFRHDTYLERGLEKGEIKFYEDIDENPGGNLFHQGSGAPAAKETSLQTSTAPPASTSVTATPPRQLSTESSSTSSSRQQSFDEPGDGDDTGIRASFPNTKEGDSGSGNEQQHNYSAASPQSVNKRNQQPQQQMKKEGDKKTSSSLQGTGTIMPERLSSHPKPAANNAMDNKGARERDSSTFGKTTEGSVIATSSSPTFSPTKKKGSSSNAAANSNGTGTGVNLSGSGNNEGGTSNTRALKTSAAAASLVKPIPGGGATTVPAGKTGALNTASRLKRNRLKFNDDSESDSSEIGPAKTNPAVGSSAVSNLSGGRQMSTGKANSNGSKVETNKESVNKAGAKKQEDEDDDFDDFFDM